MAVSCHSVKQRMRRHQMACLAHEGVADAATRPHVLAENVDDLLDGLGIHEHLHILHTTSVRAVHNYEWGK